MNEQDSILTNQRADNDLVHSRIAARATDKRPFGKSVGVAAERVSRRIEHYPNGLLWLATAFGFADATLYSIANFAEESSCGGWP